MSIMPPDGWSVDVGTWGTDVDIDTAVSQSGFSSLKIDCTADVTIYSDWMPVVGVPQTSTDKLVYEGFAVLYTSNSTENLITITLEVYEDDRTTLVDSKSLSNVTQIPNTSTWTYVGKVVGIDNTENTARWARIKIVSDPQSGTSTGNVWIDRISLNKTNPFGVLQRATAAQAIPATTATALYFQTVLDEQSTVCSLGSAGAPIVPGAITILEPGTYSIQASITCSGVDANSYIHLAIGSSLGSYSGYGAFSVGFGVGTEEISTIITGGSVPTYVYLQSTATIVCHTYATIAAQVYGGHAFDIEEAYLTATKV